MNAMGWRVWVEDFDLAAGYRVYRGVQEDWALLPNDGVLCVMIYFDDNAPSGMPLRRIATSSDSYFMFIGPDGHWAIGDNNETVAEVLIRYPGAIVKRGKWTSDQIMQRVSGVAMESRVF